jgi:multisite-specific tRNA:(cytosine-C5)-methyltransferase
VDEVDGIGIPDSKKPRLQGDASMHEMIDKMPDASENFPTAVLLHQTQPAPAQYDGKNAKGKGNIKHSGGTFKENPYTFLLQNDPILLSCMLVSSAIYLLPPLLISLPSESLNLSGSFPSSNILVRNPDGEAVRSLYLTNDLVKSIVQYNDYSRLRLTACGTKVFAKQEAGKGSEAQYRILGEGLPVILPFLKPNTVVDAPISALKTLVEAYYPLCAAFVEPFRGALESRCKNLLKATGT